MISSDCPDQGHRLTGLDCDIHALQHLGAGKALG